MNTRAQDERQEQTPPRRRRRKAALWLLGVLAALTVALGGTVYAMLDRAVDAPHWVRERIEARIAEALPGITVDFGRMSLLVQRSGLARVILWDVSIRNAQGGMVAQLSDIEAGLSPAALIRGRFALREAQVSGAFVTLRRDAEGRIGLALGDAFAERTEVPSLGEMIARIDALAENPRLAGLDLFEADALTLRYEDRRARRGWTADGGRLRLTREDGTLGLSGDVALLAGGDGVATVKLDAASRIGDSALDFGITLEDLASADIATQSPALAWLEALDAPISGALRSRLGADGTLGPMQAELAIGAGVLQPNRETRALPFDSAETAFTYTPDAGILRFESIRVVSPLGRVSVAGTAQMEQDGTGWLSALTGQFAVSGLTLAQGAVLERPLAVSGATMAFKLTLDPFTVELGRLRITDPAFPVQARGTLLGGRDGWDLALDFAVEETTPAQVMAYWPTALHPNTRRWLANNVQEGRLSDITFALRAAAGETEPRTFLDLAFEEGAVRFAPTLPRIEEGRGRLTLYGGRLGLRLDAGQITPDSGGSIALGGSEFVIPDLDAQPTIGEVRLQARAPIGAALSFLDNDDWRVLRRVGRDASMATGQGQVAGLIRIPLIDTLRRADIGLALDGTLRGVESRGAIPGRVLTADSLGLTVTDTGVAIEGAVEVSGVPARGRWRQPFESAGGVEAELTLTPQTLASLGVTLPSGMLRGRGTGDLSVSLGQGRAPAFTLTSDLAGLALSIPQLGWSLAPGTRGEFRIAGTLGDRIGIDGLSLRGGGLEATGDLLLNASGGFERLELAQLRVADWLDVQGRLIARGGGQGPAVEIASGTVDMRRAPFGSGGGGAGGAQGGTPLALRLDRLQVTDSIVLRDFRGNFETARGLAGRFDAQLGGVTPVEGQVIPQGTRSAFRIEGEDAGDVLKAAGFLKTVQDGSLKLDLAPVAGQPGSYDGLLNIREARLQKAPAITSLLDAVSIVGLLDQINGPGIFFSDVEARFRMTPSRVIVSRSSAVGPSMGISMDGYYDLASGQMDMQGVLSPIYVVNAIGRLIARKGEGLIGFNFNLRGSVDDPRVAVNPLSVFTPGMFRDIFRRPPPKLSQ